MFRWFSIGRESLVRRRTLHLSLGTRHDALLRTGRDHRQLSADRHVMQGRAQHARVTHTTRLPSGVTSPRHSSSLRLYALVQTSLGTWS